MNKYTVILNNDGKLNTFEIESNKDIKTVCREEYKKLLKTYEDLDECNLDEWTNADSNSYTMGCEIDYCMGHEYIYNISVKVENNT